MTTFSQNSSNPPLRRTETDLNAIDFHALELSGPASIWLPQLAERPTLVLGSSQDDSLFRSADEVAITRRRSGGGAVLVSNAHLSWFDIWLPRDDVRSTNDVTRSFDWLGRILAGVLTASGYEAHVHAGPMVHSPWSKVICFAGLGPGEITIGGKKAIGISQRRNREGARFQVAVLRRWSPLDYLELLDIEHADLPTTNLSKAASDIASLAVPLEHDHDEVVESMINSLT